MRMTACLALAAALLLAPAAAIAHHGWTWTTGGNIDLTGIITKAALGNPHGLLTVDVEGEIWTVEVGQPWRNERAVLVAAFVALCKHEYSDDHNPGPWVGVHSWSQRWFQG